MIFDLDGTVYRGGVLIPGAVEAIRALRDAGMRIVFVSNNPTATAGAYSEKLTAMGVATRPAEVLTSGGVAAEWLRLHRPDARVFVVGEESLIRELKDGGVVVVDGQEADVVLAAFDRTFDYAKWNTAFQALLGGALFAVTNPDVTCPVADGVVPDCAGIVAALEVSTGRSVDVLIGKPSSVIAEAALERLGLGAEAVMIVGDRVETDVETGRRAGMQTALVLTGVTNRHDLDPTADHPTYVVDSVARLPDLLGVTL
ncbi:HAD-IIA family hydrolase [Actinotalea sp. Marseille-Q4924]|uniref:HAD-IIA family hydrolase n=1 Tax=Actinotalea sp. Marseille-Q4924 TaxID=2866571 RepID=UPI001CE4A608|nr:HAD-IIA family hydrolase [Actinotalea sp. Marseille-Q4924]